MSNIVATLCRGSNMAHYSKKPVFCMTAFKLKRPVIIKSKQKYDWVTIVTISSNKCNINRLNGTIT